MNTQWKFDPDAFLESLGTDHDPAKVARLAKVAPGQPLLPANSSSPSNFSSSQDGKVVSLVDRIRLAAKPMAENFEERAAIAEYEGGLSREAAERQAWLNCSEDGSGGE